MELKSKRLIIRPVSIDDKDAMFSYRSDIETSMFLSVIPKSVDDIAEFISKTSTKIDVPGSWFQLVLTEQSSKLIIGDLGIHFLDSDSENKQVEIGYTLAKRYRGEGYATEALIVVIDYLINTLQKHRITASIDPANNASIKLIERLGFRKEAHFVESLYFHGKWVDDVVYAILEKEWDSSK